jgi:hypothetical protein
MRYGRKKNCIEEPLIMTKLFLEWEVTPSRKKDKLEKEHLEKRKLQPKQLLKNGRGKRS